MSAPIHPRAMPPLPRALETPGIAAIMDARAQQIEMGHTAHSDDLLSLYYLAGQMLRQAATASDRLATRPQGAQLETAMRGVARVGALAVALIDSHHRRKAKGETQ